MRLALSTDCSSWAAALALSVCVFFSLPFLLLSIEIQDSSLSRWLIELSSVAAALNVLLIYLFISFSSPFSDLIFFFFLVDYIFCLVLTIYRPLFGSEAAQTGLIPPSIG